MKISITEKPENAGEISELREQVLSLLTSDELFAPNKQELCYHSLKQFDFQNLDKNNKSSIEDACNQIVKLIGMESDALIELGISDEPRLHDPMNRFMHYFLGLDMVPGIEKQRLVNLVQQDLVRINMIITDYETNYQFIADGETPRNHNQRTIKDFYDRCTNEKDKIEEYLNNGLEERVKEKAGLSIDSLWGFTRTMMSEFLDRPYQLHIPRSNQFFKHDDINQINHRIGPLSIKDAAELRKLYNTDKEEFYKELEAKLPTDKIFTYLINSIKWLPQINSDRVNAFQELETLYKNEMYWGFYSLAIPQIEGLFMDMGKLCVPNYNHIQSALPNKVQAIRHLSQNHDPELDYFQYRLPNIRNSYLHYGTVKTEDLEILCKEILFDLFGVIQIFNTLNADPIWLNILVKGKKTSEFSSAQSFSFYFDMKKSVKQLGHEALFAAEINFLNQSFFPDIILGISMGLNKEVTALTQRINDDIKATSKYNGFEINLNTISNKEIAEKKDDLPKLISECFNHLTSEINDLIKMNLFLKTYKQNLDVNYLDPEVINTLDQVLAQHSSFIGKVMQIKCVVKV